MKQSAFKTSIFGKDNNMSSEKKKSNTTKKSRLAWLWENMEGKHGLFIAALIGTVVYNIMQLIVQKL